MGRTTVELADIVRGYGDTYCQTLPHPIPPDQLRVLRAVAHCRTAALGGHVEACGSCGHERIAYNSCRNRHCAKCQSLAKAHWLEARQAELLPVPYAHVGPAGTSRQKVAVSNLKLVVSAEVSARKSFKIKGKHLLVSRNLHRPRVF